VFTKIILTVLLTFALIGCATTGQNTNLSPRGARFQVRIAELEKEIGEKEARIRELESELAAKGRETETVANEEKEKEVEIDVSRLTAYDIQSALKKGGYYTATIDGKIGPKTREAIKEFQKTNGLKVDGKVGKQTWSKLQKLLQ
jgi:peptidoglycan hydrolase-like protein with peptidoglycan-binding domain